MSGVWEGLLSVQDSGRPQNITHASQGTEASQDQVIHPPQQGRDRDTGNPGPKTTTKDFSFQLFLHELKDQTFY